MNKISLLIVSILFLVASSFQAHAGFWVKKHAALPATAMSTITYVSEDARPLQRFSLYSSLLRTQTDVAEKDTPKNHKSMKTAWKGIASICCSTFGVAGFIMLGAVGVLSGLPILLIIAGVVFGIMGMGKKNKYNGLAIAGFSLGILGLFLLAMTGIILGGT